MLSPEKHNELNEFAEDNGANGIWLGGHDIAEEGSWAWIDGSGESWGNQQLLFTNWRGNAPSGINAADEDCLVLDLDSSSGLLSRLYTTNEAVSQNHVDGFDLKIPRRKLRVRTCIKSRVYSVRKYSEVSCVPECVYSPAKCLATSDGSDIGQNLTPFRPLSHPLERDKGDQRS